MTTPTIAPWRDTPQISANTTFTTSSPLSAARTPTDRRQDRPHAASNAQGPGRLEPVEDARDGSAVRILCVIAVGLPLVGGRREPGDGPVADSERDTRAPRVREDAPRTIGPSHPRGHHHSP